MTTYILLMNWTEQGARNIRESPKRLDAAKKQLANMGGSFKAFYLTMGEYDMVAIIEAPDDAVLARFALMLATGGSVKTRTLKAFPEFAYREIVTSLG
ncbi:GYD family protein [Mesorhizobium sp. LSJC265A00]|uniref:GYD domain-containing protein n=1 Tax=Mesorhizobium sp. LSJC265A00 TaxID=1287322 RepID=UPI0003CF50DB|nr:GYD domain-containing protein [Mesorhizobium sp. LSJC265A00]ESX09895.1 GYD family protein [Mesorhizobium sp. LSJC265A00]